MPGAIDLPLERLAELLEDPQKEIYSLMYFRYPDFQYLFLLDKNDSVRDAMLQTAFEFLLVYSDQGLVNKGEFASWRSHHLEYVVEEDILASSLN